jgi:hypothetical protein
MEKEFLSFIKVWYLIISFDIYHRVIYREMLSI